MRVAVLAVVAVLAFSGSTVAGPFGRRPPAPRSHPCPCPMESRHPRLAAIARGIRETPPTLPNRPVGSTAVSAGFTVLSFASSVTLQAVATGGPQVIRLSRVLLVGSPTPGRPLDTVLWVASPSLLAARNAIRELRALRGRPVVGW